MGRNVQTISFLSGLKGTLTSSLYSSSEFDKEDSYPTTGALYSLLKCFLKTSVFQLISPEAFMKTSFLCGHWSIEQKCYIIKVSTK